jgi:hypothetical protein
MKGKGREAARNALSREIQLKIFSKLEDIRAEVQQ